MSGKILITARSFRKSEGPHKQILRDAGYELVESPNEQPLAAAELAKWLQGAVRRHPGAGRDDGRSL